MNNKLFIFILSLIFLTSLVSADLGCFKQNDAVPIVTVLNASAVNLTNVNSPAPNSSILITNKIMTANGNFFNYTFSNTSQLGTYTYGYCSNAGECYSNSFKINGSGQCITDDQITLIIIGIVVMLIVTAFFFILSILFKHPGTKIFLMSLSSLTLIVVIGIITSNAAVYLAEFPSLASVYDKYYIFIITLAGAAMMGIIGWLIYYSLSLFNKARGRTPDDD